MNKNVNEVDLITYLKKFWLNKGIIILFSSFFILIGIVSSLLEPFVFKSSTTFIPSSAESAPSSGLSGVASLVGINISAPISNEIPASMYPQVAESVEFKQLLLKEYIDTEKSLKMIDYLIDYHEIEFESNTKDVSQYYVSKSDDGLFKLIDKILPISVNLDDGFVTITAEMPTSEYAATTAVNAREILQEIIIDTKIKSAKQNLDYSVKQLDSKKSEFEEIQNKLAFFNDSNLNLVTSSIINEREKLEAEFEIVNAVMIELSKQVEQSKLQVSKDTPVFSIIKEARMPVERSSPQRTRMVLTYGVMGLLLSMLYVLVKKPLIDLTKEITGKKERS